MAEQLDSRVARGLHSGPREHQLVERVGRIGHWFLPAGERVLSWSPGAAVIHGCEGAPPQVGLDVLLATVPETYRSRLVDALENAIAHGRRFDFEIALHIDEGERIVRVVGECEWDSGGRAEGVLVVVKDVSGHRAALAALADAEARQADFLDTASDWLWEMDADLRFTYFSPHVQRMGVSPSANLGRTRRELLRDEEITPEVEAHLALLERHEPFRDFCYWRAGQDGTWRCISTSGKPVFGADGTFLGYRGCGRDSTSEQRAREDLLAANTQLVAAKRRAYEAVDDLQLSNAKLALRNAAMARAQIEIQRTALHDALTGLPNRQYLDMKLAGFVQRRAETGQALGVLHIDLDRFKQINDTLGHAAGDAVLRHVAAMLSRVATSEDFVARVGGDEYVLVCTSCGDERGLETMARRLIEECERPVEHDGRECWFGASIGIAAAQGDEIEPKDLLVNADIALHRAKAQGRGSHCFFSDDLQREVVRHKAVADSVLAGIKRREFVPFYQPQICAETWAIVGVEALARWRHPVEGVLAPDTFLAIAEDLAVVATLDHMILEAAVADLGQWREAGVIVPKLSVNVSARRLLDRDLIGGLARMALPRGVLAFELLESVFLDSPDETIAWNIDMLKDLGIEVELDDFGSGHASIISLVKLGPDAIKIDRELISAVTEDRTRCGLVRSIIEIGRTLDTRIIAEGVETGAQAELLRKLGCDALQGYHFARPMAAPDFLAFARRWQGEREAARTGTG